ncbi:hypothetical protein ACFSTC_39210 [Nonomuraea ferruginea]
MSHAATASSEESVASPVTSLCAASWREIATARCRTASSAAATAATAAQRASTDSADRPPMTRRRRRVTRRASRTEAVTKLSAVGPGGGSCLGRGPSGACCPGRPAAGGPR